MATAFTLILACSKDAPPKQFVARVDQEILTEDELGGVNDSLARTMRYKREYINEWVNSALLYQEAIRRGLGNNDGVRKQIEWATRKLVVAALLDGELYGEENVTGDEIVALYNGGGNAFRLREDVVKVSYVLFGDRDAANSFRSKLLRGTEWNVAVEEAQKDSLLKPHLVQVASRQFFTQSNLYPAELWKLARNLGENEVSFVVKTAAGYYILVAHGVKRQGELPELEYVRNEIRDRILVERRRLKYEKLLTEVRSKHSVEVRLAESDTLSNPHE